MKKWERGGRAEVNKIYEVNKRKKLIEKNKTLLKRIKESEVMNKEQIKENYSNKQLKIKRKYGGKEEGISQNKLRGK